MMNKVKKRWSSIWSDICGIARTYPFACIAAAAGMLLASVVARYIDGQSLTAWSVEVWDAIVDGPLNHNYAANIRQAPHGPMGPGTILCLIPWAIWNLPLWVTHPLGGNSYVLSAACILWSKLGLIVCAFAAGLVCGKIVGHLSGTKEPGWTAAILFWGSGTLSISVEWCMQDEIFYILALLCAVNDTIAERPRRALVWMIVSATLNPAMMLPCLFLILYQYQKLIIRLAALLALVLPNMINSAFLPGGVSVFAGNGINWYFQRATFSGGFGYLSTFGVISIIIVALQFFNQYETKEEKKRHLLYFITCCMTAMNLFSWSHVYRFFLCIPFLIISVLIIPDTPKKLAGMAGICAFEYCSFLCACFSTYWAETRHVSTTIRQILNVPPTNALNMYSLLLKYVPFLAGKEFLLYSVVCACGLWILWLVYPKQRQKINCNFSPRIIVGMNSMCAILFASVFCLLLRTTEFTAITIEGGEPLAPALTGSNNLDEYYKTEDSAGKASITIRPVTWNREYPQEEKLVLEIIDVETDQCVGRSEVSAGSLPNNQLYTFELEDISVKSGRWYIFRLSAAGQIENEDNYLYVLRSKSGTADPEKHYAIIRDNRGEEISTDFDWISQVVLY